MRPEDKVPSYEGLGTSGVMPGANQHLLRFCDTAEQARDFWVDLPLPGPQNRTIADVSGKGFVVEHSAAFKEVRTAGLELPRFRGHLTIGSASSRERSPHGEDETALRAGVPC